jgi:heat shock protein HslJ
MKIKIYFTISLLMVVLLGCYPCSNKEIASQGGQTHITSDNFSRIAGMQWILRKMIVDGSEYPLAGEMPFVKFETDGKINGFASINRFFGSIEINPQGQVKWSKALGSTRMAGPEELMKQEDAFLKALPKTEQLAIKGIYLYAHSIDRQTEYIFYVPVE